MTTNESTNTSPVYPETVKLFSSTNLGIQFYYNTAQPEETAVKQIGDTVYVYPSTYADPKNGQFVQVFTKDASDTLAQAITKRFLSGISTKDCFITPLALGDVNLTSTQSAAIIDWPSSLIDDNNPFGDNSKCPKAYQKTNGQRYFLTDSQAPTKLLFFSIGQYAITVDNVHTWQSTLRFISPTADWKTYTNTTVGYQIQYPSTWKVTNDASDATKVILAPQESCESIELCPAITLLRTSTIPNAASPGTSSADIASKYDCNQNRKTIYVNKIQSTQQEQGCFATIINTYIPENTQYIRIAWPQVFSNKDAIYDQVLSTFTFTQ